MHETFANRSTLLLDMDGTLLDLAYDNHFWMQAVPERLAQTQQVSLSIAQQQVREILRAEQGTLNWYCLDFWSRSLAFDVLALKREYAAGIGYLPGAQAFLSAASSAGYRLILVTNSSTALLQLKDEKTGICAQVDAAFSSEEFGAAKESQSFWQRFMRRAGLQPTECVLLDDSAPVLRSAMTFGLGSVLGIEQPDSGRPANNLAPIPSVAGVQALISAR